MPAVGDVWEFRYVTRTVLGANQINVRHGLISATVNGGTTDQELVNGMSQRYATNIVGLIPTDANYQGCLGRRVSPTVGPILSSTTGAAQGTLVGDDMPGQVCGIITLRAETAPPRRRGRVYVPSTIETNNGATGLPTGAHVTALQGWANTMWLTDAVITVGAANETVRNVLFHRVVPQANYLITSAVARTYWATQRRRSQVRGGDRLLF